jgi:hypothetical protein
MEGISDTIFSINHEGLEVRFPMLQFRNSRWGLSNIIKKTRFYIRRFRVCGVIRRTVTDGYNMSDVCNLWIVQTEVCETNSTNSRTISFTTDGGRALYQIYLRSDIYRIMTHTPTWSRLVLFHLNHPALSQDLYSANCFPSRLSTTLWILLNSYKIFTTNRG